MRIHLLGKTTTGGANRVTRRGHFTRTGYAKQHTSTDGSGLKGEIFENSLNRVGDLLNKVHLSKPRIQKKYISFDL